MIDITTAEPPLVISNSKDRFGYYQVGHAKFYSKLEAAQFATKSNQPLKWIFHDDFFSRFDWTQEPQETLAELYRQRAQQLRDRYDYLVLFLSGGADSSNILRAFVDNNIKLDEVACYTNYGGTKDTHNHFNGEIYHVVPGMLRQARERQPWIKHTVIDISPLTMTYYEKFTARFDWIYDMNHYINPNNISRQDIKLAHNAWRKMFDSGKRVAFIHGCDKPCVQGIKGKYYFAFKDMIDGVVSSRVQQLARPWEFDELFYWSPDALKILIKQAHTIKNYFTQSHAAKNSTALLHRLDYPAQVFHQLTSESTLTINSKIFYLTRDQLHRLIYPNWQPVPYQIKPHSLFFSQRDSWFFNLSSNETAKYAWKIGLEEVWRLTPDIIKQDPRDLTKGLRHIKSKVYELQ